MLSDMESRYPQVLAILWEARNQGIAPLLRTAFVKYLYLLDVYYAEENNGRTLSGWDWRFLHFGPFTDEAVRIIDSLVEAGAIRAEQKESVERNKEFVLYDLAEHRRAQNLRSIGISGSIELRIQSDMRRYGTDLPRLLDYVYFRTEPMTNASPGQVLDFSKCERMTIEDVRLIQMRKLRPKAIKTTREKLRQLIRERRSAQPLSGGPFDEAYFSAIEALNTEPVAQGLKGKAKLNVE